MGPVPCRRCCAPVFLCFLPLPWLFLHHARNDAGATHRVVVTQYSCVRCAQERFPQRWTQWHHPVDLRQPGVAQVRHSSGVRVCVSSLCVRWCTVCCAVGVASSGCAQGRSRAAVSCVYAISVAIERWGMAARVSCRFAFFQFNKFVGTIPSTFSNLAALT
jgi:hypothetical protein